MIGEKDVIEIGFLRKPHGYKGELNADLDFDGDLFADRQTPFIMNIDGILVPFHIDTIRKRGEGYLIKFEDIDSDKDASILVNHEIYALKSRVIDLTGISEEDLEDDYDLIGATVRDAETGKMLGTVKEIEEGKEYDYLNVEREEETEALQIPMIDPFIKTIEEDEDGRVIITVMLPEGMLYLNSSNN